MVTHTVLNSNKKIKKKNKIAYGECKSSIITMRGLPVSTQKLARAWISSLIAKSSGTNNDQEENTAGTGPSTLVDVDVKSFGEHTQHSTSSRVAH